MSFEPNDMNTIHLGNYEEFFILYMDNELAEKQVKMVEEFLGAHPDLKADFEMLMSTRLPLEEFIFDKKDLLAENMKQTLVDEELLLYIDDELPSDKKKTVELEIASNKDYHLQHQLLLQTKLDRSEKIEYPNKKELHRRTQRVIAMRVWMRVAAVLVIIAVGGILYFRNPSSTVSSGHPQSIAVTKDRPVQQNVEIKNENGNAVVPPGDSRNQNDEHVAVGISTSNRKEHQSKEVVVISQQSAGKEPTLAQNKTPEIEDVQRNRTTDVMFGGDKTIALAEPKISINKADVTSALANRINNSAGDDQNDNNLLVSNDRKGSVKGFLRKATRMIEKRTGIDPTNENGQLLIGAVAINLK